MPTVQHVRVRTRVTWIVETIYKKEWCHQPCPTNEKANATVEVQKVETSTKAAPDHETLKYLEIAPLERNSKRHRPRVLNPSGCEVRALLSPAYEPNL